MTISILAFDEKTESYGGAATTGNLCVGAWVLRGDASSGVSASQGSLPSTLWGTDVLVRMRDGMTGQDAVRTVTQADSGRDERQLAALDIFGGTGHFTGAASVPVAGVRSARHVVVSGNMLDSEAVLDACLYGYLSENGPFPERLMAALSSAAGSGGDSRGLMSAAILIISRKQPPLDLRVDYSEEPLEALGALYRRASTGLYAEWTRQVPTVDDPMRAGPLRA